VRDAKASLRKLRSMYTDRWPGSPNGNPGQEKFFRVVEVEQRRVTPSLDSGCIRLGLNWNILCALNPASFVSAALLLCYYFS